MSNDLPDRRAEDERRSGDVVAFQHTQVFRGQIPPPEALREYEAISPGITGRLLDEVEREAIHRRAAENQQLSASEAFLTKAAGRLHEGQRLAFGLILVLIAVGTALGLTGHDNVAAVVFGTTVLGIASIFVLGKTLQPTTPKGSEKPKLRK